MTTTNFSLSLPETEETGLNALSRGLVLRVREHNRRVRTSVPGETRLALPAVATLEQEHLVRLHFMDVIPSVLLLLLGVCQERVGDVWVIGLAEPPVLLAQSRRVTERERVAHQRLEWLPYLLEIQISKWSRHAGTPSIEGPGVYLIPLRIPVATHQIHANHRVISPRKVWIPQARTARCPAKGVPRKGKIARKLTCTKAQREADFAARCSSSRVSAGMPS